MGLDPTLTLTPETFLTHVRNPAIETLKKEEEEAILQEIRQATKEAELRAQENAARADQNAARADQLLTHLLSSEIDTAKKTLGDTFVASPTQLATLAEQFCQRSGLPYDPSDIQARMLKITATDNGNAVCATAVNAAGATTSAVNVPATLFGASRPRSTSPAQRRESGTQAAVSALPATTELLDTQLGAR